MYDIVLSCVSFGWSIKHVVVDDGDDDDDDKVTVLTNGALQ